MANPNVADKDGNISNIAETNARCGDWCKQWINGECAITSIAKTLNKIQEEIQVEIAQEERRLKIHIKNQTDKKIDLCCGLDQELTLRPEREATVEVQDGDYIYIDQAI
jgi:hypothetical protein